MWSRCVSRSVVRSSPQVTRSFVSLHESHFCWRSECGSFCPSHKEKKKKVKSLRRLNVGAATRPHLGAFSGQHKAAPLGITRRHGESCEKEGFFLSGGEAKKSDTSIISDISLRNLNMNAIKKKEKKTLPPCVRASLAKGEDVCGRCYGAVVFA